MPQATATTPHSERALEYCQQVADGKQAVCRWVRLACERHLRDLEQNRAEDSRYYFDAKAADRVCDIVEHFPHIKGVWAQHHNRLSLEPWQSFIVSSVFGWMVRDTQTRRFRVVYIEVPRKNAKSTLTAAIGNYLAFCDGEAGAYVVSAANALKQAKLVFTDAQDMARREPGFRSRFGVQVLAHAIVQEHTASRFEALSAEYSNLAGLNVHGALIDELHAHPNRGLWDILETATGSRSQPLIWSITHAGTKRASVCYDQRKHVQEVLEGRVRDDSYFGIIYTLDEDDDPWAEASWVKANPNYGVSIYPETIRSEAARAQTMPSMQNTFLMNHCNIWVSGITRWLPVGAWDKCAQPTLSIGDFEGQQCFVGVDLAMTNDIAAIVIVFPPLGVREEWACFGRYYLPMDTIMRGENSHLQGWEAEGLLTATPGNTTDFDYIVTDLLDWAERFQVVEIVSDPYKNVPLVNALQKGGFDKERVINLRGSAANMTPPMVGLEGLVTSAKIRHDGDPILSWMMANVSCYRGQRKDTLQPQKEDDASKIDGAVALLNALNRALRFNESSEAQLVWGL